MRLRPLLSLWLLLALSACGGGPGPGPDASTGDAATELDGGGADAGGKDGGTKDAGFGPVPIERYCESKAWAECAREQRCLALQPARFEACTRRKALLCQQAEYTSAVRGGRLQYFSAQAAQCLNAYATGACTGTPAACEGLLQGLVPADAGCLLTEECRSGSYCLIYDSACPHRCLEYKALGEPCNSWDRQCDPATGTCASYDGGAYHCEPRRGVGQSCVSWSDCREDLACISVATNDYRCVKRSAQLGESCAEFSGYPACAADAFCRQPPASGTPPPGTCQKRQGLGGVCSGYSACLPGLRCSSTFSTGTCVPLGADGETCGGYGECGLELYCSVRTSTCNALPADGGNCGSSGSSFQCQPDYFCDYEGDVCAPRRALGQKCPYDDACLSGACEYGRLEDAGFGSRCVAACLTRLDGGT